jgi:hypothetical protein
MLRPPATLRVAMRAGIKRCRRVETKNLINQQWENLKMFSNLSSVIMEVMLVFIDDSGDPGFKLEKGSSHIFTISCVIFTNELEAEKTAVAIKELRRDLKFPDEVEFKFNKSRRRIREKFLYKVNPFKFKVRSLVIGRYPEN